MVLQLLPEPPVNDFHDIAPDERKIRPQQKENFVFELPQSHIHAL